MRKYLTIKKEPKCIHISKYSTFMLVMKTVQKKTLKNFTKPRYNSIDKNMHYTLVTIQ